MKYYHGLFTYQAKLSCEKSLSVSLLQNPCLTFPHFNAPLSSPNWIYWMKSFRDRSSHPPFPVRVQFTVKTRGAYTLLLCRGQNNLKHKNVVMGEQKYRSPERARVLKDLLQALTVTGRTYWLDVRGKKKHFANEATLIHTYTHTRTLHSYNLAPATAAHSVMNS